MTLTDDVWTITAKPATQEIVVRWQSVSSLDGHVIDHTATFKGDDVGPLLSALTWLMPRLLKDKIDKAKKSN